MTTERRFRVGDTDAGKRLDGILAKRARDLSRRMIRELFRAGHVLVDGRRAAKGEVGMGGSEVVLRDPPSRIASSNPDLALDVVLERPDLVIVNKPAGQPSTARDGTDTSTTVNALLARYPEMTDVGYSSLEGGLVHRLDTGTSGLMLAARTRAAFQALSGAVRAGAVRKEYLAIVRSGREVPPVIESGLAAGPGGRVVVVPAQGSTPTEPRRTELQIERVAGRWTLVRASAARAYRHQIRVHLAAAGLPIAGDELYGGERVVRSGHALHASHIAWPGDGACIGFSAEAPLPRGLRDLLLEA